MLTLYLDNSDYSRFADCISGRGEPVARDVLEQIINYRDAGKIQIPYSIAILSELVRYEDGGRELALRKAQALSFICKGRAFRHHGRLIAAQAAAVAKAARLPGANRVRTALPVSLENGWYPAVGNFSANLKQNAYSEIIKERSVEFGLNRKARRAAESKIQKYDLLESLNYYPGIVDRVIEHFPIPREHVATVLPKYIAGSISHSQFGTALLSAIANPETFVVMYYERYTGDHSLLDWMRDLGEQLHRAVSEFRERIAGLEIPKSLQSELTGRAAEWAVRIARKLLETLSDECGEIGLHSDGLRRLLADDGLLTSIPYFKMLERVLPIYFQENSGFRERGRAPTRSDGGDMAHALYIPFCDIWRGDVYFASLLRRCGYQTDCEIVSRLSELPDAIARRLGAEQDNVPKI